MELIKHGRVYDFMSIRKYWIAFSLILSVLSAILIWKPGPRYGIDFLGGTELTVQFESAVDTGRIRDTLESRQSRERGLFDTALTSQMCDAYFSSRLDSKAAWPLCQRVWQLYVFEEWAKRHLDRA